MGTADRLSDGLGGFWLDLRTAARQLARRPGLTAAAVASLGAGIGVTVIVFSVANAFFLRAGLRPDPSRLVYFDGGRRYSAGEYAMLRAHASGRADLAALHGREATLQGAGSSERLQVEVVSPNYFTVVGVRPGLGRLSPGRDEGDLRAVVLSWRLWQHRFGGERDVVGSTVIVDSVPLTVLGVAPRGYEGLHFLSRVSAWVVGDPSRGALGLELDESLRAGPERADRRFGLVARLGRGVPLEEARAIFDDGFARLGRRDADGRPERALLLLDSQFFLLRTALVSLFTAVAGLVLLVGSVNVAGFLAARLADRRVEIATRLALGGSRWHLVRLLLAESLLLASAGAAAGVLLTAWLSGLAFAQLGVLVRHLDAEVPFDARVLAVTVLATAVATLATGLLPARPLLRSNLASVLKHAGFAQTGSRGLRPQRLLVVAQLAVCFGFLTTAGLYARAAVGALRLDAGLDAHEVVLAGSPCVALPDDRARACRVALLERVRAIAGVQSATVVTSLPLLGGPSVGLSVEREGSALAPPARATLHGVGADYFELTATRPMQGRVFSGQDERASARVAVIDDVAARRLWPGEDPIGRSFRLATRSGDLWQVIGVVRRTPSLADARGEIAPVFYVPASVSGLDAAQLVVRTRGDASGVAPAVGSVVADLGRLAGARGSEAPRGRGADVVRLDEMLLRNDVALFRLIGAKLLAALALIASALALAGVAAVLVRSVALRTREFGLRAAIGAPPSEPVRLVLREGARLASLSLALGLPVALAASRLTRIFSHQVPGIDFATLAAGALALLAIAALAAWLPARRASRVDPIEALRCE